jgi:DNA-binding MarR family transcriptional regulator
VKLISQLQGKVEPGCINFKGWLQDYPYFRTNKLYIFRDVFLLLSSPDLIITAAVFYIYLFKNAKVKSLISEKILSLFTNLNRTVILDNRIDKIRFLCLLYCCYPNNPSFTLLDYHHLEFFSKSNNIIYAGTIVKMESILSNEKYFLWTLLNNSSEALMAARGKEIEKIGLTSTEHRVLLSIPLIKASRCEIVTPSELSRWLFRNRSTICELLSRMEKKGLIKRIIQPGRKKTYSIEITEKGYNLREKGNREGLKFVYRAMSTLSEQELNQLRTIIGKLRAEALLELGLSNKPPFPQFL